MEWRRGQWLGQMLSKEPWPHPLASSLGPAVLGSISLDLRSLRMHSLDLGTRRPMFQLLGAKKHEEKGYVLLLSFFPAVLAHMTRASSTMIIAASERMGTV